MARTIVEDEQLSTSSLKSWARVIVFGLAIGVVYWLVTLAISNWIVEPLACRQLVDAASCVNAPSVAGKITTILIAVIAIAGMVRLGIVRPVVIAIAAAIILWELSLYTEGLFWLESLGWTAGLYALTYALFGWIVRATSSLVAIIIALVITLLIRISLVI